MYAAGASRCILDTVGWASDPLPTGRILYFKDSLPPCPPCFGAPHLLLGDHGRTSSGPVAWPVALSGCGNRGDSLKSFGEQRLERDSLPAGE